MIACLWYKSHNFTLNASDIDSDFPIERVGERMDSTCHVGYRRTASGDMISSTKSEWQTIRYGELNECVESISGG